MKARFEVLCTYTRQWEPMGRRRNRCPKCGAVVGGSAHPIRLERPAPKKKEAPAGERVPIGFAVRVVEKRDGQEVEEWFTSDPALDDGYPMSRGRAGHLSQPQWWSTGRTEIHALFAELVGPGDPDGPEVYEEEEPS